MNSPSIPTIHFGSRWSVVYVRVVQIVLFLIALLFLPQRSEGMVAWLPLLMLALVKILLLGFVQAMVTDDGLTFRRWKSWKLVRWSEMEKITQHPLTRQVVVRIAGRQMWSRYLLLSRPKPRFDVSFATGSPGARFKALASLSRTRSPYKLP